MHNKLTLENEHPFSVTLIPAVMPAADMQLSRGKRQGTIHPGQVTNVTQKPSYSKAAVTPTASLCSHSN